MINKRYDIEPADMALLQRAGAAAGYVLDDDADRMDERSAGCGPAAWNPLDDDGDAFRLAVKLRIQVTNHGNAIHAHIYYRDDILGDVVKVYAPITSDDCAATRRAIVLAASDLAIALNLTPNVKLT